MANIYFYIPNQVILLDLSGILQVFQEAKQLGFDYHLKFVSGSQATTCASGLELSPLTHFSDYTPTEGDLLVIPGLSTQQLDQVTTDIDFHQWLKIAHHRKVTICSICTGAFLLAKSGILNGQACTTHWRFVDKLKADFPLVNAVENRLFVKSNNLYTSAGVATGIDLALFLIEERHGNPTALKIAKELAIYKRRNGTDVQESVFLQYRNHHDKNVHIIQDWIIQNLDKPSTLESLADHVHMSPRSLTRIFRKQTGITIAEYRTQLRVEKAQSLIENTDYKLDHVASLCGFNSSRQLRLMLNKTASDKDQG